MRYLNEEIAFATVFGSRGDEESASNEHYDLESSNPFDTIPVATFFDDNPRGSSKNVKMEYFYVCNFDATSGLIPIARQKCSLVFSIRWDPDFLVWSRHYWLACDGASSHNEAAEWLIRQVTIKDRTNLPDIDHLKSIHSGQAMNLARGTLKILNTKNLINRIRQRNGIFGNPFFLIGQSILQLLVSIYIGSRVFFLFGIKIQGLGLITSLIFLIASFYVGGFILTTIIKFLIGIFESDKNKY